MMPNPFPGMDPWLEDDEVFPDLHDTLITYLREALNAGLPPGYVATTSQLVWVDDEARREPDVSLLTRRSQPGGETATALAGMLEIGRDRTPEPWEEPYLEIVTAKGRRLVTAVEVLSPANKATGGKGRQTYLDKREEFRLGGVNVVEIDLLRAGAHTTAVPRGDIERRAGPFDYHVCTSVAGEGYRYFAAPIRLADRLPAVGIPLDPGVPAVTVDLQPLLDRAYDTGRYAQLARYDRPPAPSLTPEQAEWAAGVLRAKGVST